MDFQVIPKILNEIPAILCWFYIIPEILVRFQIFHPRKRHEIPTVIHPSVGRGPLTSNDTMSGLKMPFLVISPLRVIWVWFSQVLRIPSMISVVVFEACGRHFDRGRLHFIMVVVSIRGWKPNRQNWRTIDVLHFYCLREKFKKLF